VVEHRLAKARVASSNLVSRSIPLRRGGRRPGWPGVVWSDSPTGGSSPAKARYPSGKGEVCKTFMRRFDPDPRLQFFQWIPNNGLLEARCLRVLITSPQA
jgi:hypothetical protein